MPVAPVLIGEEKTVWERLLEHMPELMVKDMLDKMDAARFGDCVLEVKNAKVQGMQFTSKTRPRDYGLDDF